MDAFVKCKNVFTNRCSGEVEVLISAAQRYGFLNELARERIESICRLCKNFSTANKAASHGRPRPSPGA